MLYFPNASHRLDRKLCGAFAMKKNRNEEGKLVGRMAEAAGVPKELVLGVPVLQITGREEIRLENYRGIQEYTEELIRIQTRTGQIRLEGKRLKVEYYTNDEMKVTGWIQSIEYL